MKLISMKMSKKEAKQEFGPVPASDTKDLPKYPYDLRIRLDTETLKKLGIDIDDYEVGDDCTIEAKGEVIGIDMHQRQDGEERSNLEIQITGLGINWPEDEAGKKQGERLNRLGSPTKETYTEE